MSAQTYAYIIVADTDAERRRQTADPLKQWGWYHVLEADSVEQIFQQLTDAPVDLVITHVSLAIIHQFSLLKYLRQNQNFRHLPVILAAEIDKMQDVASCMAYGEVDYLPLPLALPLLRNKVIGNLEKQQLLKQVLSSMTAFNTMKKVTDDFKQIILPLGISLSVETNLDRLLEVVVTEAQSISGADMGILYLREDGNELRVSVLINKSLEIVWGGRNGALPPYPTIPLFDSQTGAITKNVAALVAATQQSANIADIYAQPGNLDFSLIKGFDQQFNYQTTSCLTVVMKSLEVTGVLQLFNARDPETKTVVPFTLYHQQVLESLASQAAVALQNHILRKRQVSLKYYERELEIGRQLQADFLPVSIPQPAGWELAADFHPAREVAGDFYDLFATRQGKIGIVIADICDKGMAAALFMALIRTLIRAFGQRLAQTQLQQNGRFAAREHPNDDAFMPEEIETLLNAINATNEYIHRNHRQTHLFATLFFGILDPRSGKMMYINGGHNPPFLIRRLGNQLAQLDPTGPALGLSAHSVYELGQVQLAPGDTFVAYTDGVTEARNPDGVLFTRAQLADQLAKPVRSASGVLRQIETAVRKHIGVAGQYDDITLVAARRLPTSHAQEAAGAARSGTGAETSPKITRDML